MQEHTHKHKHKHTHTHTHTHTHEIWHDAPHLIFHSYSNFGFDSLLTWYLSIYSYTLTIFFSISFVSYLEERGCEPLCCGVMVKIVDNSSEGKHFDIIEKRKGEYLQKIMH